SDESSKITESSGFGLLEQTSEVSNDCSACEEQEVKVTILSRKNETGQLFLQVKLLDASNKRNSWQVDIDHDSGSSGRAEGNRTERRNLKPPAPFYEFIPGLGYYKYHNEGKKWYDAKIICNNEGAHLAIVNSKKEVSILKELYSRLPKIHDEFIFIGMTDAVNEGSWVTIFDESLNETGFSEWNTNEPNKTGFSDHDAQILQLHVGNRLGTNNSPVFK
ncbi:hypothetical protein C0J52_12204, partial [Blattella germanica]